MNILELQRKCQDERIDKFLISMSEGPDVEGEWEDVYLGLFKLGSGENGKIYHVSTWQSGDWDFKLIEKDKLEEEEALKAFIVQEKEPVEHSEQVCIIYAYSKKHALEIFEKYRKHDYPNVITPVAILIKPSFAGFAFAYFHECKCPKCLNSYNSFE